MKLGIVRGSDVDKIREISRAEVRILWVDDFYDAPLQGMAEFQGSRFLFEIIDRDKLGTEEELHRYWLIVLSDDQLRDEESWHELFCRKVGTHFDYTGRASPPPEQVCLDEFYVPYGLRAQPDYGCNDVIGWFSL